MMSVSLKPYRVKVSTVVRALVSHQCGLDFNPVGAVMSVEFVVGSCNIVLKGFSLRTVVFTSPQKSSFPYSNLVSVEKTNGHSDFWIKPSFSQFICLFICLFVCHRCSTFIRTLIYLFI